MLSPRAVSPFERCKPRAVKVRGREAWGASPRAATPGQATDGEGPSAETHRCPPEGCRRLASPQPMEAGRRGTSVARVIPESSGSLIRIHPAPWVVSSGPRGDRSQSQMLRPVQGPHPRADVARESTSPPAGLTVTGRKAGMCGAGDRPARAGEAGGADPGLGSRGGRGAEGLGEWEWGGDGGPHTQTLLHCLR